MSIYYSVREHLSIKNTANAESILHFALRHFFELDVNVSTCEGHVRKFSVTVNENNVSVSELQHLLNSSHDALSIDLIADYDYYGYDFHLRMSEFLDEINKDDTFLENVLYSMYNSADCADGVGILCAYGRKDGKTYSDVVEPIKTDLPTEGTWTTEDTAIVFDEPLTDEMNVAQIRACVDALKSLGTDADVQFTEDDDGVALFVNYLSLDAKFDFIKFIDICRQLLVATNNQAGIMAEFVCFDTPDAQTLFIDINDDGSVEVKRAKI